MHDLFKAAKLQAAFDMWTAAMQALKDPFAGSAPCPRARIGAPFLEAFWRDPAFDPAQRAFYYARVPETPTPRWTAYDAAYYKVKMGVEVPMVTQERAFTSPIWYAPK